MKRETHRLALSAAARLVLGSVYVAGLTGLSACASDATEEDSTSEDELRRRRDAGCHADAAPLTDAQCVAAVKSVFPKGALSFSPNAVRGIGPNGKPVSKTVMDCCEREAKRVNGDPTFTGLVTSPVRWECCDLGVGDGASCTPWGPPVPPAMPRRTLQQVHHAIV
jgi:hypothetical protein